jgi:two-component system, OmpR family, response regulator
MLTPLTRINLDVGLMTNLEADSVNTIYAGNGASFQGDAGIAQLSDFFVGHSALILEDDTCLAEQLGRCLTQAGFGAVVIVGTGRAAVLESYNCAYDILVFDRLNPDLDGASALGEIRAGDGPSCRAPALLVTALDGQSHRLEGFIAGADDYLPKPISETELLARIAAQLRRAAWSRQNNSRADGPLNPPTSLSNGPLLIDLTAHFVSYNNVPIHLTGKEFSMLAELSRHCGDPVTRLMLWDRCWPEWTYQPEQWTNTIDVAMRRLRKAMSVIDVQLPDGFSPLIVNVRSEGFLVRDLSGVR